MQRTFKILAVVQLFAAGILSAQTSSNTTVTVNKTTGSLVNATNIFAGNTNWIIPVIAPFFSAAGSVTSINGLTGSTQTFDVDDSGTDFNIVSSGTTHTFNIPFASSTHPGKLSHVDFNTFTAKVGPTRQVIAGAGLTGGGALSSDVTVSLATTSSGIASAISDETGSGSIVLGTSPTIATPTISGAISFPAGTRQTFAPNATTPGVNVGSVSSDPSSPSNGDLWLQSTSGRLRSRLGGASVDVATGAQQDFELTTVSSGANIVVDLNANQYQTLTLSADTTLTTSNRAASKGRVVTMFVTASGAQRTVTLNANWKNYGSSSSVVIPSGKEACISMMSLGSAETDVRVDYRIQP